MMPEPLIPGQYDDFAKGARVGVHLIADGIWCAAIPYRFGVPYSLTYLVKGGDGSIHVVDPGADLPGNRDVLVDAIAVTGATAGDVASIAVTHMHQDHVGMAAWLSDVSGCDVHVHAVDLVALRSGSADSRYTSDVDRLGDLWGVPEDSRTRLFPARYEAPATTVPSRLQAIHTGGGLDFGGRPVAVVHSPGHTGGHTCFVIDDAGLVLSGDLILPHINTPLGRDDSPEKTAVQDFLTSMSHLRLYDDYAVGPGHGYCFQGLGPRRRDLTSHVIRRIREVRRAMIEGSSDTWDVARRVSWGPGWENLSGAMLQSALSQTEQYVSYVTDR